MAATELKKTEDVSQGKQLEIAEKIYEVMHGNGYMIESVLCMNGLYTTYDENIEVVKAIRFCELDDIVKHFKHLSTHHPDAIDRKRDEKSIWCHDFDEQHCDCFLPNITKENCYCAIRKMKKAELIAIRQSTQYKNWRKGVLKRDNKVCQHCGSKKQLHAHHIKPFATYPKDRFDIKNGVTLCSKCHKIEHSEYGNSGHI